MSEGNVYGPCMQGVIDRIRGYGAWKDISLACALERLFCTLGGGYDLDHLGEIRPCYHSSADVEYPDPEPLTYIYPYNQHGRETWRAFAGCATRGFKEAVEYFLACLEVTPDEVKNVAEWKAAIPEVREVLLNTPTIQRPVKDANDQEGFQKLLDSDAGKPEWSDKTPSFSEIKLLSTTWTSCPKCVIAEVQSMWQDREFGNDYYYAKCDLDGELFDSYPLVYMWAKHNGLQENETFLVHYWW